MAEATRDELNQKATDLGLNPDDYSTKAELQEAIEQHENNSEDNSGVDDTVADDAAEHDEDRSNADRADESGATVDGLHDTRDGAERDGTKELERPHDSAEGRSAAVQAGKDAARENLASERAADKADGSDNPQKQ